MARQKTLLRKSIERFLEDTSEGSDNWLSIVSDNHKRDYSMAFEMRKTGYPIDVIEYDRDAGILWISRITKR